MHISVQSCQLAWAVSSKHATRTKHIFITGSITKCTRLRQVVTSELLVKL